MKLGLIVPVNELRGKVGLLAHARVVAEGGSARAAAAAAAGASDVVLSQVSQEQGGAGAAGRKQRRRAQRQLPPPRTAAGWARRHDPMHLLGRRHWRCVLQDTQRTPPPRLEGSLRENLSQNVIRVREVASEESREGSDSRIQRVAHVSEDHLVPLRHRRVGRVHQHMLQCRLHVPRRLVASPR